MTKAANLAASANATAGNVTATALQSNAASTPTLFKDSAGTEVGTLCRAWANWTSAATPVLNAAFNVSSVTKNATGQFTANFTTALSDTNYSVASAGSTNGVVNGWSMAGNTTDGSKATSSIKVIWVNASGTYDPYTCNVAIFR